MELECIGVIVDDDDFSKIAVKLGEVLDMFALVEARRVLVETVHDQPLLVQRPGDGIDDPKIGGGEEDYFIVFAQILEEAVDAWPFGVAPAEFGVPGSVDEGVFQVEDEGGRAGCIGGDVGDGMPVGEEFLAGGINEGGEDGVVEPGVGEAEGGGTKDIIGALVGGGGLVEEVCPACCYAPADEFEGCGGGVTR